MATCIDACAPRSYHITKANSLFTKIVGFGLLYLRQNYYHITKANSQLKKIVGFGLLYLRQNIFFSKFFLGLSNEGGGG